MYRLYSWIKRKIDYFYFFSTSLVAAHVIIWIQDNIKLLKYFFLQIFLFRRFVTNIFIKFILFPGTDRNNIAEVLELNTNFPLPFESTTMWKDTIVVWSYHGKKMSAEDLALNLASSGYYEYVNTLIWWMVCCGSKQKHYYPDMLILNFTWHSICSTLFWVGRGGGYFSIYLNPDKELALLNTVFSLVNWYVQPCPSCGYGEMEHHICVWGAHIVVCLPWALHLYTDSPVYHHDQMLLFDFGASYTIINSV